LKKRVTPSKPADPKVPRPGVIPAINYWRALQILKQTPFKELLAKAKEEAPHFIYLLVALLVAAGSVLFTAYYLIKSLIMLVARSLYYVVTFFTGTGGK
jgi:hypothetical protein